MIISRLSSSRGIRAGARLAALSSFTASLFSTSRSVHSPCFATVDAEEISASRPAEVKNLVHGSWKTSDCWNTIVDPLNGEPFNRVAEVPEAEIENWASSVLTSRIADLAGRRKLEDLTIGPVLTIVTSYKQDQLSMVLEACERMHAHLTAAVVSNDPLFLQEVLGKSVNGTTYAGIRARTTGSQQNHWFGPAGDPRGAGIGTPEAIKLVWSCHREIIYDIGPFPHNWDTHLQHNFRGRWLKRTFSFDLSNPSGSGK